MHCKMKINSVFLSYNHLIFGKLLKKTHIYQWHIRDELINLRVYNNNNNNNNNNHLESLKNANVSPFSQKKKKILNERPN